VRLKEDRIGPRQKLGFVPFLCGKNQVPLTDRMRALRGHGQIGSWICRCSESCVYMFMKINFGRGRSLDKLMAIRFWD